MPQKNQKGDWKRFEELVGRLERILGNESIRVKINDQIRDNTGELRQIDASVRVSTGTAELLYIIECRKRHKVSDVTWVEQIATKCRRVGAVKAILVSNKPLSSNAVAAAKNENIDVRTLEELDPGLFTSKRPWMRMSRVRWSPQAKVGLLLADSTAVSMDEYRRIRDLAAARSSEVCFDLPDRAEPQTMEEIVSEVREALQEQSFPPGEKGGQAVAQMVPPGGKIDLLYQDKRIAVRSLTVTFVGIVEETEPNRNYVGHYQHPDGTLNHVVAEHDFTHDGKDLTFTSVANTGKEEYIVNIPYGFGDPEVLATMDKEKGATIKISFDDVNGTQITRLH